MKQYLDACKHILENGIRKSNRTGIDTIGVQGMMMKFDMANGFPAVTTKKLHFNQVIGELLGFIRGYDNAADFRKLGVKIWDANANDNEQWLNNPNRKGEDDLGDIYGVQWRGWQAHDPIKPFDPYAVDQFKNVIHDLSQGIDNRREIVLAWNPGALGNMALPPCHMMFQFGIDGDKLNLGMYQRSCDFPLGVPFNIASYALLLHMVAQITGLKPGVFTHFLWDCHIYVNQIDGIREQLEREPKKLPQIAMNAAIKTLDDLETWVQPHDFALCNYDHHPAIKFPFAV